MNPPSAPKPPAKPGEALALAAENVTRIRAWYRRATSSGRDLGHTVMAELVLAHVADALRLACEGKVWIEPDHLP